MDKLLRVTSFRGVYLEYLLTWLVLSFFNQFFHLCQISYLYNRYQVPVLYRRSLMYTNMFQKFLQVQPVSQLIVSSSYLFSQILTLSRMGVFEAAHGWGSQKGPLPKICHKYPTKMKLGTVIPYLQKMQKIYESRDTLLKFC